MNAPSRTHSLAPVGWLGLIVGAIAAAACAMAYESAPATLFRSYLVGYLFCLGIALGSWAVLMLHNLTGGAWGVAIRRILEAAAGTLPVVAVLFVPFLFGLKEVYIWARPEAVSADALLQTKSPYLNATAFMVRAAVYFGVWIGVSTLLNRWSAQAQPGNIGRSVRRQQLWSGPGLILYGLTITFASVDWAMSTDPHWYSSMYGVLFIAGQAVSTLAFATLILILLGGEFVSRAERRQDLGNLLLAFVMFWTYIAFMQFLIIWSGNLPEETPWYLHRSRGGWQYVAVALAGLHFLVPFFLLLSPATKRSPWRLAGVALLLLVMRLVDLYWLIMPTFTDEAALNWINVVAPLAVIGLWLAAFTWQLSRKLALPEYHLYVPESAHHEPSIHPAT